MEHRVAVRLSASSVSGNHWGLGCAEIGLEHLHDRLEHVQRRLAAIRRELGDVIDPKMP
jgi:hypothetical protein